MIRTGVLSLACPAAVSLNEFNSSAVSKPCLLPKHDREDKWSDLAANAYLQIASSAHTNDCQAMSSQTLWHVLGVTPFLSARCTASGKASCRICATCACPCRNIPGSRSASLKCVLACLHCKNVACSSVIQKRAANLGNCFVQWCLAIGILQQAIGIMF